jgi:Zn finger protein HypA/HybF involved in hydrogenase expression
MIACPHRQLVLVRDTAARLRCRHCHLTIKAADLSGRYCPECLETTHTKRYDFEEIVPVDSGSAYYRCEACGSRIETP